MIKIKDLKEPYRSQAICNLKDDRPELLNHGEDHILNKPLKQSFFWGTSPEGFKYWQNVKDAHAKEIIQQIADENNIKIKFL